MTFKDKNRIKQKIINNAKKQLEIALLSNKVLAEDYGDFLRSLANGLCPICKTALEIIEAEESENSFDYEYKCGHGWSGRTFKEEIKFHESIKIKVKQIGVGGWVKKMFQGFKSSDDPKLSEGVNEISVYDYENDWIDKIVKDNKTGDTLDEHHEPLTKHKPHNKRTH